MKNKSQYVGVGLFFILGLVLTYIVFEALSESSLQEKDGYKLEASFSSIKRLATGDDVRMAGVKIGKVADTRLEGEKAVAVLLIEDKYQIPGDSTASVDIASLLGSNYISITYGTAGTAPLTAGQSIQTRDTADIGDIVNSIGELGEKLNSIADSFEGIGDIGGEQLDGIFAKVEKIVDENGQRIENILTNVEEVSVRLKNGEGTLGKLLSDEEGYDKIMATVEEIEKAANNASKLMTDAQEIVAKVKSGEGTIGQLVYSDDIANELKQTVQNLQEFSDSLNKGEGTLGKLVKDDELYNELKALLGRAERALGGVEDAGPISAVGVGINVLF